MTRAFFVFLFGRKVAEEQRTKNREQRKAMRGYDFKNIYHYFNS